MIVYLILELILLIYLIVYKWVLTNETILDLLTFLPIFITAIYMFINRKKITKHDKLLYTALLIALVGDIFLIYIDNVYGIYSFLLVQLLYFYYFNNEKVKKSTLILCALLVLGMCLNLGKRSLFFEGVIYIIIFGHNLYISIKYINNSKKNLFIIIGFILLAICDTNVFIVSIAEMYNILPLLEKICFTIEWVAYISFQLFISFAITKIKES